MVYVQIWTRQSNGNLSEATVARLATADIDAKLPDRPSLEGYKVEMLSLDQAVHLFRNFAKLRAYLAGLHRAGGPHA